MKHLIFIILSLLGFSCTQKKQEEIVNNDYIIDVLVQTTPLMQPYLCLSFSREYCDSIRAERETKLKSWAEKAKSIKNKDAALDYFMSKVSELRNDVNLDYTRALNKSLRNR